MCSFSFLQNTRKNNVKEIANAARTAPIKDATAKEITTAKVIIRATGTSNNVNTDGITQGFVAYAKTLVGTPYVWGSVNPNVGFDCSGFINHVSNHFGIKVPRSSVEFTNVGTSIETNNAKPGDLILFTGSDPAKRVVGHMGIITDNDNGQIEFIHSSSGKAKGVIVSEMSDHYKTRFIKVIRIFPVSPDKVVG